MSFRPADPAPYSQGLRKPSGNLLREIRKSLIGEIIPATVWTFSVSWVLENGRRRVDGAGNRKDTRKHRRAGPARERPDCRRRVGKRTLARRCRGSHDSKSCTNYKVSKGQVTAANSLEETFILALEVQDEIRHCIFLVPWPRKVLREATSREIHCHFREASSSADGSDVGTCETIVVQ